MRVFMTGGTGFVGSMLTKGLTGQGHRVTLLTRRIQKDIQTDPEVFMLEGNPTEKGSWQEEVAHHDLIINLAGASIFRRWTEEEKRRWKNATLRVKARKALRQQVKEEGP